MLLQLDESYGIHGKASTYDEVKTLMVDKEESVRSTTEHQRVQTQDSYPPVLARKADKDKSVNSTADHQPVQRQGSYPSVSWVLQKKADPSTYQELYPDSTLNLIASDDNETRRCSSPQIEREATTVSDQITVPSSVQEHQNDEGQGEEGDEHVPNPSVHRQYLPPTTTDVPRDQLMSGDQPTPGDQKFPGTQEGDQLLPKDQLMSGDQPTP